MAPGRIYRGAPARALFYNLDSILTSIVTEDLMAGICACKYIFQGLLRGLDTVFKTSICLSKVFYLLKFLIAIFFIIVQLLTNEEHMFAHDKILSQQLIFVVVCDI